MTPLTALPLPGTTIDPCYPDGDGEPMAETPFHLRAIVWLYEGLEDHFAGDADVFLSANMFMYYERGEPSRRVAPDVLVAKGAGGHVRRSYRIWEECVPPRALFEIASEDTWTDDLIFKRDLYARLGVGEYFLFDPETKYLNPPLQGFRLNDGVSLPISPESDGSLLSLELGLRLVAENGMIRLISLATGEQIMTRKERIEFERENASHEEKNAAIAQRQVEMAEILVRKTRELADDLRDIATMARERADHEKARADLAVKRAEEERENAEQERQRSAALEAELARLRAWLPPQARGE